MGHADCDHFSLDDHYCGRRALTPDPKFLGSPTEGLTERSVRCCIPGGRNGTIADGANCTVDEGHHCRSGLCIKAISGLSASCGSTCTSNADCPESSTCVSNFKFLAGSHFSWCVSYGFASHEEEL